MGPIRQVKQACPGALTVDKHRRQSIVNQKRIVIPTPETSSLLEGTSAPTLASTSSPETAMSSLILKGDSTSAPRLGERDNEEVEYASSYPALLDKYAFSKWPFSKIVVLVILGWIVIQDNGAGKLTNWQGVLWTLQKLGVFLGLFLLVSLGHSVYQRIFKKS